MTQGALAAARALRNVLAHLPAADADDALVEEFPWVELLPPAERRRFSADFVRAVQASAELGRWSVLAQVLVEWKATAAIYADPELLGQLRSPVESDFGAVPAPGGDWGVPAKRGDRVAPPARPRGWEARFATSEAAKGWEQLCRVAKANTWEAWVVLTERPTQPENPARQHRLRGDLATRLVAGEELERRQSRSPPAAASGTVRIPTRGSYGLSPPVQSSPSEPSERHRWARESTCEPAT